MQIYFVNMKKIKLKHIVPSHKKLFIAHIYYTIILSFCVLSYSMVYYILPTIITPIGKLFVCIQHSSLLLYVPLLLKKAFIIFVLALYSSDENHFISWRTIYGPTSCFFFTLNTLMYTVIICTHIYIYIYVYTHSFPELLKKQYIYLTCIYLLLDRTMIAYLFHTLFMNINRTEIQHMVHNISRQTLEGKSIFNQHLCIPLS